MPPLEPPEQLGLGACTRLSGAAVVKRSKALPTHQNWVMEWGTLSLLIVSDDVFKGIIFF